MTLDLQPFINIPEKKRDLHGWELVLKVKSESLRVFFLLSPIDPDNTLTVPGAIVLYQEL